MRVATHTLLFPLSPRALVRVGVAASALSLISCGDGTGTGPAGVASVVVTGVPATPVIIGDSFQLVATAINATGGIVSNQTFIWRTSDAGVAVVGSSGLVRAIGAGPVTITASTEGKQGSAALRAWGGGSVGTAGATLTMGSGSGTVTLTIPPFAVPQTVTVLLAPASSAPPSSRLVAGTAIELGPDGLQFSRVVAMTLGYAADKVPAGTGAASLQLYVAGGSSWTLVPGSTVDATARTVSGGIWRSGTYAVVSTAVGRLKVGGGYVNGALYVGQSGQLNVTAYDADNNVLNGRDITWSSSDPTRVQVDGTGKITALSAGSATIRATSEGTSDSTTITSLARPAADWSNVTEWVTYQGNPSHTGYVDVTVDPVAFAEAWTVTVESAVPLNPVTAGNGSVFVSTNSYFGTQALRSVNAQTGAVRWTKTFTSATFGSVHGVHPPAYGNGSVYVTTSGHQDSFLWSFDALSGAPGLKSPYGNQWSTYKAPVVLNGAVYMAGGYYDGMYGFNATTGDTLWFRQLPQVGGWTPAVKDGRVYAYGLPNDYYTVGMSVFDATSGDTIWTLRDNRLLAGGTPVLGGSNELITLRSDRLVSVNLATKQVQWEKTGSFFGTAAVGNGTIYVLSGQDLQARSESDGTLQWSWTPPEGSPTGEIVVTRNIVFVSTSANTYGVDIAARRQGWSFAAGGSLTLSAQRYLFIAQQNGKLTAIAAR
jgi:PQQ-like domain/Bacterial Ig-like domain (group 2)